MKDDRNGYGACQSGGMEYHLELGRIVALQGAALSRLAGLLAEICEICGLPGSTPPRNIPAGVAAALRQGRERLEEQERRAAYLADIMARATGSKAAWWLNEAARRTGGGNGEKRAD